MKEPFSLFTRFLLLTVCLLMVGCTTSPTISTYRKAEQAYYFEKNYPLAMKLWLEASQSEDKVMAAKANLRLGDMYNAPQIDGKNVVPKDSVEAIRYYKKAIDLGSRDAITILAYIYNFGDDDVPRDKTKAIALFEQSSKRGDTRATNSLFITYSKNTRYRDYSKASVYNQLYMAQAAGGESVPDGTLMKAKIWPARTYAEGYGVKQDKEKAESLLQVQVDDGNTQAMLLLGEMSLDRDTEKAMALFSLAYKTALKNRSSDRPDAYGRMYQIDPVRTKTIVSALDEEVRLAIEAEKSEELKLAVETKKKNKKLALLAKENRAVELKAKQAEDRKRIKERAAQRKSSRAGWVDLLALAGGIKAMRDNNAEGMQAMAKLAQTYGSGDKSVSQALQSGSNSGSGLPAAGGSCKNVPPACQRAQLSATNTVERISNQNKTGSRTILSTQYCISQQAYTASLACASAFRSEGDSQCASQHDRQASSYQSAMSKYRTAEIKLLSDGAKPQSCR